MDSARDQRRRSPRQISEPLRFVARPSKRGLSDADGDAIFLTMGQIHDPKHTSPQDIGNGPICLTALSIEDSKRGRQSKLGKKRPQDGPIHPKKSEKKLKKEESDASSVNDDFGPVGRQNTLASQTFSVPPTKEKILVSPRSRYRKEISTNTLKQSKMSEISDGPRRAKRSKNKICEHDDEVEFICSTSTEGKDSKPLRTFRGRNTRSSKSTREIHFSTQKIGNSSKDDVAPTPLSNIVDTTIDNRVLLGMRRERSATRNNRSHEKVCTNDNENSGQVVTSNETVLTAGSSTAHSKKCSSILQDNMLDFQIRPTPTRLSTGNYRCRAISCHKYIQGTHGFCHTHFNRYRICTGQCAWWECECGNRNIETTKRCRHCRCVRNEKNIIHARSDSSAVTKKAGKLHKTKVNAEISVKRKAVCVIAMEAADACGEVVDETILCQKTSDITGGIRSLRTFVPLDSVAEISQQRRTNGKGRVLCKVNNCGKFDQTNTDGFCKHHFNKFAVDSMEDLGGDVIDSSVCDCGQVMGGERKQCASCRQVRYLRLCCYLCVASLSTERKRRYFFFAFFSIAIAVSI